MSVLPSPASSIFSFSDDLIAPTDVTSRTIDTTTVEVTWTDRSSSETGYRVERTVDGVNWGTVGTTAADVEVHLDSTVVAATDYTYRVIALGAASQQSAPANDPSPVNTQDADGAVLDGYTTYASPWSFGFEVPTPPEWSYVGDKWDEDGDGMGRTAARFFNESSTLTLRELPAHSHLELVLELGISAPDLLIEPGDSVPGPATLVAKLDGVAIQTWTMTYVYVRSVPNNAGYGPPMVDHWTPVTTIVTHVDDLDEVEHTRDGVTLSFEGAGMVKSDDLNIFWAITGVLVTPLIQRVQFTLTGGSEFPAANGDATQPLIGTLTRSGPAGDEELTVDFDLMTSTNPKVAQTGSDYDGTRTAVFAPNENSITVEWEVIDDDRLEPNEIAFIRLKPGGNDYRIEASSDPAENEEANRKGLTRQSTIPDDDVQVIIVGGRSQGDRNSLNTNAGIRDVSRFIADVQVPDDPDDPNGGNEFVVDKNISATEIAEVSSSMPVWFPWPIGTQHWPIMGPLEQAIDNALRQVRGLRAVRMAMAGYSWGGGAIRIGAQYLHEREVRAKKNIVDLDFTAYVDAIWLNPAGGWDLPDAENQRPIGSVTHVTIYQAASDPGVSNRPHGSGMSRNPSIASDEAINVDDSGSHILWKDDYSGVRADLGGIESPDPLKDNMFVHAARDPEEGTWRIDNQEPIMHYIARQLVQWI